MAIPKHASNFAKKSFDKENRQDSTGITLPSIIPISKTRWRLLNYQSTEKICEAIKFDLDEGLAPDYENVKGTVEDVKGTVEDVKGTAEDVTNLVDDVNGQHTDDYPE